MGAKMKIANSRSAFNAHALGYVGGQGGGFYIMGENDTSSKSVPAHVIAVLHRVTELYRAIDDMADVLCGERAEQQLEKRSAPLSTGGVLGELRSVADMVDIDITLAFAAIERIKSNL